jgi:anti-sigma B factor antagonist
MNLEVAVRFVGNVAVVDTTGRITLGDECTLFRNTMRELFESSHKDILLNFKGLTYVDSAGLGELTTCYITSCRKGGQVRIVNARIKIQQILEITHLLTFFMIFSDETEAIRSFGPEGDVS